MKRLALCLAVLAVLAACPKSSEASDLTKILRIAFGTDHRNDRYAAHQAHLQHHAELQARVIERELVHQAVHQQPLTIGPHGRPHNELNRAAYHDMVEYDVAHTARAYTPRMYPQPSIPSYRGNPYGYNVQNGFPQYQRAPYEDRVGCPPYQRY